MENQNQNQIKQPPEFVELKCVKEKSKLRVKIVTPGYFNDANCQFPRDLRIEGRKFRVRPEHVKLVTMRGKWFYSVLKQDHIEIVKDEDLKDMIIYEDKDDNICSICMTDEKRMVFNPCGHYYTCINCSKIFEKCPYCSKPIDSTIDRTLIG